MISKEKPKQHIDKFPDDEISIDDLIERLIFIEKLEQRIGISEQGGSIISEDAIKKGIEKRRFHFFVASSRRRISFFIKLATRSTIVQSRYCFFSGRCAN